MKSDIIIQLHKNFEDYAHQIDGEEFWFARDLQGLLGYSKWENFAKVIEKAKIACQTAGHSVADHFPDVRKTIPMPKGAEKEIDDLMLMARKRTSPLEDVITLASKLPWWSCLLMALVSYGVLHSIAARPMIAPVTGPGQLGAAVTHSLILTMAMFGQLILPFVFCIAAIGSAITALRQKKLYNTVATRTDVAVLNEMSWDEFEMLVGEHFRRQGFQVSRQGGNGPDGGVDLVLKNISETYLVQCKQWKAYKVGVQPVRELYGVMASLGAAGGYVVTSGMFTDEAQTFAKGLNVELIDGRRLRQIIDNARKPAVAAVRQPAAVRQLAAVQQPALVLDPVAILAFSPNCPKCGAEMKKRTARQGSNAGNEFWGCSAYPACKGVLPITPVVDAVPVQAQEIAPVTPVASNSKSCPQCGDGLVIREFKSGPRSGEQFLGCLQCKKGYPLEH